MLSAYLLALISGTQASASGSERRSICAGFSPGPCWKTPWVATSETVRPLSRSTRSTIESARAPGRAAASRPRRSARRALDGAVHPVMVGGQVELARAAGDARALLDGHEPLVLAQVLARLARQAVQVREGAVDLARGCWSSFSSEIAGLARSASRKVRWRSSSCSRSLFRSARLGHLEDLEDPGEAGVVVVRAVVLQEEVHAVVEILEPQQRAHALVQGIFVGDHGRVDPGSGTTSGSPHCGASPPVLDKCAGGPPAAESRACRRSHCASSAAGLPPFQSTSSAACSRRHRGHCAAMIARTSAGGEPRARRRAARPGAPRRSRPRRTRATRPAGARLEEQRHHEHRVGAASRRRAGAPSPSRISGCRIASSRARAAGSEKASARMAARSSAPPGGTSASPNASRSGAIAAPPGAVRLAGDLVGVDDGRAQLRQDVGGGGLARADAAREPDGADHAGKRPR